MKIKNSILCIVALSALLFSFSGCASVKDESALSLNGETSDISAETNVFTTGITTAATTEPAAATEPLAEDIPDDPNENKSDVAEAAKIVSDARKKTNEYDVDAAGSMGYEVPSTGVFDSDIKVHQDYTVLKHTDDNGTGSYLVSVSDGTNSTSYTSVDGRIYINDLDDDGNLSLKVVRLPDGENEDIPDLTSIFGGEGEIRIPGLEGVTPDRLFGKAEVEHGTNGSLTVTFSEADAEFINGLVMSLLTGGASGEETDPDQGDMMSGFLLEILGSDAVIYDIQALYTVNADGYLVNENLSVSISINVSYSEDVGAFSFEMFRFENETEYRTVEEGVTITAPENADQYEEITLEELMGSIDAFKESDPDYEGTDN